VETLEQRLAPAVLPDVLPAAIVSGQQMLTPMAPLVTNPPVPDNLEPQVAVDPVHPSTVFAVYSTATLTGGTRSGAMLEGFISTNSGSTWNPVPIGMPPDTGLTLDTISGVSVGIDRTEEAYVVYSFHNAGNSAGAIELTKFNIANGVPVQLILSGTAQGGGASTITLGGGASSTDNFYQGDIITITGGTGAGQSRFIASYAGAIQIATVFSPWTTNPDGTSTFLITSPNPYQVLYTWPNGAPAYNPTVIVDNNVPNYVDPTTGAQTVDSMSGKAVYVTWNTDTSVMLTGSTDGGLTFSTIQNVADGTTNAGQGGNHPRGFITQGTPTNPGGQFNLLYDKPTNGTTSSIALIQSRPDNGVVSQSPLPDTLLTQTYDANTGKIAEADPGNPKTTQFFFNITPDMFPANFDLVDHLDVILGIVHPDVRELSVVLKSPVLDPVTHVPIVITLFNNSLNNAGGSTGQGIPGTNGFTNLGAEAGTFPGTIFDNTKATTTSITVSGNTAPFIGSFNPESGTLQAFKGLSPLQLSGQWELDITDNRADPAAVQNLGRWAFRFTPQTITVPPFSSETTVASGLLPSSQTETYATALTAAGAPGIGPEFTVAVDNTLGGYSQSQGNIYVAYTGPGANTIANGDSDVFLVRSTDGGVSWGNPLRINSDSPADGFSEGIRAQFQPQLAVDPVTGTLVATWYDARYDASNMRVANFLATSIDGGVTFGPQQAFLNQPITAKDALTGQNFNIHSGTAQAGTASSITLDTLASGTNNAYQGDIITITAGTGLGQTRFVTSYDGGTKIATVNSQWVTVPDTTSTFLIASPGINLGPIPSNTKNLPASGYGDRQGLAVYAGHVYPFWSGNFNTDFNVSGQGIFTANVTIAAGPRVLQGDGGPIGLGGSTDPLTTSTAPDGTPQLTGFTATFDRPIDPATITPSQLQLQYHKPSDPAGTSTDLTGQITGIQPLDNGAQPFIAVGGAIVNEGNTGNFVTVSVPILLSIPQSTDTTINYTTVDGTAVAGTDYVATSGVVVIKAGQTTGSITVSIIPNNVPQGNRSFLVNLTGVSNGVGIASGQGSATVTIIDDDAGTRLTVGDATVIKSVSGTVTADFPVLLSQASAQDIVIKYSTVDGTATAGTDYTGVTNGQITIPHNSLHGTISIPVLPNNTPHGNLNFTLDLGDITNAAAVRQQATATIVDAANFGLTVGDAAVDQAMGTVNVPVFLSAATNKDVHFQVLTIDGSAFAGTDYTAVDPNHVYTVPAGMTQTVVPISIINRTGALPDRTFRVQLISGDANFLHTTGNVTIFATGAVPSVTIGHILVHSSATAAVQTAMVPVQLSFASGQAVTVTYDLIGTPDHVTSAFNQTLTFNPGETLKYIPVSIASDNTFQPDQGVPEVNQFFSVNLLSAQGAIVPPSQSTSNIIQNNLWASIADSTAPDAPGFIQFTVYLNQPAPKALTLNYTVTDGTAKANTDFTVPAMQSVSFAQNATSATISLPLLNNTAGVDSGQFTVQILPSLPDVGIERGTATGTIIYPGAAGSTPNFSVGDFAAFENANNTTTFMFPVVSSIAAPMGGLSVDFTTMDGNGTFRGSSPADYMPVLGTAFIPQGALFTLVPVTVAASTNPLDRQFFLKLMPHVGIKETIGLKSTGSGWIEGAGAINNDIWASIDDATAVDSSGNNIQFTVYLNAPAPKTETVNYSVVDATAVNGTDYNSPKTGSVTFQAGQSAATINIPLVVNNAGKDGSQFMVELTSASVGVGLMHSVGFGSIIYPNAVPGLLPVVSVGAVSALQNEDSSITYTFTIYDNVAQTTDLPVDWSTMDGLGTFAGKQVIDYLPAGGTAVIPAGKTSTTVQVTVNASSNPVDRQFFVTLAQNGATPETISAVSGRASGWIMGKDLTGQIVDGNIFASIDDASMIDLSGNSLTFTVYLNAPAAQAETVNYTVLDGTAKNGTDFTTAGLTGTVNFAAGQVQQTITIPVVVNSAGVDESQFQVALTGASDGVVIMRGVGIGTVIYPNSIAGLDPVVSIGDVSGFQPPGGPTTLSFTIYDNVVQTADLNVDWKTVDGAGDFAGLAGTDYVGGNGTATIKANTQSIPVTITIDPSVNPVDRQFFVQLAVNSGTTETISVKGTGSGWIMGDSLPITVTVSGDNVDPLPVGNNALVVQDPNHTITANFLVSLSRTVPAGETMSVRYFTADGTAKAGRDYQQAFGTLTFNPGQQSVVVPVTVNQANGIGGNRNFFLNLFGLSTGGTPPAGIGPTPFVISAGQATGTIVNDQVYGLSVGDAVVQEVQNGTTTISFPVSISAQLPPGKTVNFTWSTLDGTAIAGTDYVSVVGGTGAITTGNSTIITVTIKANPQAVLNRFFHVFLTSPTDVNIIRPVGTGTIMEDDAQPTITLGNTLAGEGDVAGAQFTAYLSFQPNYVVTASYSTQDGVGLAPAKAGTDYTAASNVPLNFPVGSPTQTFSVPLINDPVTDPNETFSVHLSNLSGATADQVSGTGTATIAELNSSLPTVNIGDALVRQGYSGTHEAVFTIQLSNIATTDVKVAWTTVDGTALANVDYVPMTGTATIAAGTSSTTITVPIIGSSAFTQGVQSKTFFVKLTDVSSAQLGHSQAQGVILQDNGPNPVTRFAVTIKPQSLVGDYSYAIGPNIQDRIRVATTPDTGATPVVFSATGLPLPIPHGGTADSVINVPLGSFAAGQGVGKVTVQLSIAAYYDRNLTITLIAPNGGRTVLSQNRGGNGHNFTNTLFDLAAQTPISQGVAPFTGSFSPDGVLDLNGLNPVGNWTLEVTDNGDGEEVTQSILSWSLNITPVTLQTGTAMDQDQNAVPGQGNNQIPNPPSSSPNPFGTAASGDLFANPAPADNTVPALQTQYNTATLPLIIPGPHLVATAAAGIAPSSDNLTLNGSVSSIDVIFDRDMDPTSISAANVLRLVTPNGTITGPFTLTADPSGTPPALAKRTFRIGFPTQTLSGNYSVVLAPIVQGVRVQDVNGYGMDTNLNAGLDTLRGFSVVPSVAAPIVYTQSNPTFISAVSTVKSTLTIPDQFLIQQDQINHIQLRLNITEAGGGPINDPDLTAKLISPNGKIVVTLFDKLGTTGSPANSGFANTVFDDFSTFPIQQGTPPFNLGPYNPQTPLSQIKGLSAKGTWTLSITNAKGSIGQLTDWSLMLPPPVLNDGLAEPIADQGTAGFRIFTMDPTNVQSHSQWTPVGPNPLSTPGNQGNVSGPVTAIALDPSDPSGNTAYAGIATGGVAKTTNFLSPAGPIWIPLTDFGPTRVSQTDPGVGSSMDIGGITVVPVNNNPNQSMIFVSTGAEQDGTTGLGIMRSMDAGAHWQLLESLDNTQPFDLRKHDFIGLTASKVIFDPKRLPSGHFAIYAAFGGSGANAGVYRTLDEGNTWQLIRAGDATDIVLAAGSAGSGGGNLSILYAAFRGDAVYRTTSALTAVSMDKLPGTDGFPTRRNTDTTPDTEVTITAGAAPTGSPILLAAPSLMNQPLEDTVYQGWLYALGGGDKLYMTKDFGHDWTQLIIPISPANSPTNNESDTQYNPTTANATSLAIDPSNPNVVYIGGLVNSAAGGGLIRVDVTQLADAHAMVQYDSSNNDGGTINDPTNLNGTFDRNSTTGPGTLNYGILTSLNQNYFNILFDPINPFLTPSSLPFTGITNFRNKGEGVLWHPVDHSFLQGSTLAHKMLAVPDQLTGVTRLIIADNEGIFTAAVNPDGTLFTNAGFDNLVTGNRNGNMQSLRFGLGASQPDELSAEIQGALFYGMAKDNHGFPTTDPKILQNGNINWIPDPAFPLGQGTGVATDPAGSGQVFEYRWPSAGAAPLPSDFFQYQRPGQEPNFISRITGLLRTGIDDPATGAGQWPFADGSNFVINPIDPTAIIMSSQIGNIYRTSGPTTGTGNHWFEIAGTEAAVQLDGTYAPAMAFGAPNPSVPGVLSDFIYAGTTGGNIYVTTTGGTSWTQISTGLDGGPVEAIAADPHAGFDDAYAITPSGVYYMQHTTNLYAPQSTTWINIASNTFSQTSPFSLTANMFNDPTQPSVPRLQAIHALAVDWRFSMTDQIDDGTHPVLYIGGLGGVFRSDDQGFNWRFFPDVAHEGAAADGGLLPNVDVTDLKLALGPIDQASGLPKQATGPNLLLAMTAGRGAFAIRLDQNLSKTNVPISGPMVSSVVNVSNANSEGIQVTFARVVRGVLTPTPVDPTTFTPADVVLKDPNGVIIPVRKIIDDAPVAANGSSQHNVYNLLFDNPVAGTYTISVGPNISDFNGDLMDQNNNGINGQPGVDVFHGSVAITPAARPTVALPYSDSFSGAFGDSLARQWLETSGRFQIQTNPNGTSTQAVALAAGTNMAILQLATPQANVTVQADANVTTANGAQAGLIGRYVDANDFYFGAIENDAGTYVAKIFRMFGGTLQALNSANVNVGGQNLGAGTLRLEIVNGSIKLFLNDTLQIYAFDNVITKAGNVGIRGAQGAIFANFNASVLSLLTAPLPLNENFNVPGPGGQLDRYWIDQFGNIGDVNGQAQGEAAFNLSTVNGLNLTDVSVEADVALGSGQSAGLVARYDGPFYNNFYLAQLRDIGGGQFQATLFSNIGGTFNTLAVGSIVDTGTGHLQFKVVGSSLKLLFNGAVVATANDLNLTSGSVGIRLPSGVSLDNFTVNSISILNATLPFSDDFTTSSAGSQLDGYWTNQLGDITVQANRAVGVQEENLATVNGISEGDVKVDALVNVAVGQTVGLVARYGGPGYNNFYLAQIRDTGTGLQAAIFKNIGGTFTTIAVGLTVPSLGNANLEFEVVGSSLKLIYGGTLGSDGTLAGGTLVAFGFDSSLTTGSVGMRLSNGAAVDSFSAYQAVVTNVVNLPFTDSFTTPSDGGGAQLDSQWRDQLGNISVNGSNQAVGTSDTNLSTLNGLSQGNVKVDAQVNVAVGSGQTVGLLARYGGPGYSNFYLAQLRDTGTGLQAAIFKNIDGTFTTIALGSTFLPAAGGANLEFEVVGSSLKLIYGGTLNSVTGTLTGGTLVAYGFDSSLTTGSVGMRLSNGAAVGSFSAYQGVVTNVTIPPKFTDNFTAQSDGGGAQLDSQWRDQLGNISVNGSNRAFGVGDTNLSTVNGVSITNATVTGVINLLVGSGQSVGLVGRYAGPGYSNFYLAQLRDTGTGLQAAIFKNIGGTFSTVAVGITIPSVTAGQLQFILSGSSLQLDLLLNGVTSTLATAVDTSITGPGSVGMRLSTGATMGNFTASSP
jgi:subtilisin-like proprotein convertase family protein